MPVRNQRAAFSLKLAYVSGKGKVFLSLSLSFSFSCYLSLVSLVGGHDDCMKVDFLNSGGKKVGFFSRWERLGGKGVSRGKWKKYFEFDFFFL